MVWSGTDCHWGAWPIVRWQSLIGPYFQFEFKTICLNSKTSCFLSFELKNLEEIPKKFPKLAVDCIEGNAKPEVKFWDDIADTYNNNTDAHHQ
jgi:hypothetical protein